MNTIDLLATFRQITEDSFEYPENLDGLLEWANKNAGKRLTESNKPEGWSIQKRYGMTHLTNDAYRHNRMVGKTEKPGEKELLVAHQEKNVEIPNAATLQAYNPAYWSGAEERDHKRRELLDDGLRLARIAEALCALSNALDDAHEALGEWWDIPDSYTMLRAAGLDEVRDKHGISL